VPYASTSDLALDARISAMRMVSAAGASHIGSALSVIDIVSVLYGRVANVAPDRTSDPDRDIILISKGHSASGIYAVLGNAGYFPLEWLDRYCVDGAPLGGHVTAHGIPGVEFSTGALGHALPYGVGIAIASKRDGNARRVFVVLSDGECQEGSNWEAAMLASQHRLGNLTAIIDRNRLQILANTEEISSLEPFADKWAAFGWEVVDVDGHDHDALEAAIGAAHEQPRVVIANTTKGKGVDFMENSVPWHTNSPNAEQAADAIAQLEALREGIER